MTHGLSAGVRPLRMSRRVREIYWVGVEAQTLARLHGRAVYLGAWNTPASRAE